MYYVLHVLFLMNYLNKVVSKTLTLNNMTLPAALTCYFVSHTLEFQLRMFPCESAGELQKVKLHECDIYENTAAVAKFT